MSRPFPTPRQCRRRHDPVPDSARRGPSLAAAARSWSRALLLPAVVAALAAGCAKAPAPDLTAGYDEVDRLLAEAKIFGPDSLTTVLAAEAVADRELAAQLEAAKDRAGAARSLAVARATARTAVAAAAAAHKEADAEECLQSAAEARREWLDAVHLLEQTEKVAGREARGVVRTADGAEEQPVDDGPWTPAPDARPDAAAVDALLQAAAERERAARDLLVPSADLASERAARITAASGEEVAPEDRAMHLTVAARTVDELGQRVRAEAAARRCRDALAQARIYAGYRDHALWSMVELERGLKETIRRQLDEERERLKSRQDELFSALQQFEGKFATIRKEARGTIMSLSDILFDFDKATLKRDAEFNLVRVATILGQFPEMHIYIEGHTDNIGTEEYNKKLSERRAQTVFDFLVEQQVDPERMDWFGYGMSQPIAPNNTEDGRAKNRRVDLVIGEE